MHNFDKNGKYQDSPEDMHCAFFSLFYLFIIRQCNKKELIVWEIKCFYVFDIFNFFLNEKGLL